MKRALLLTGLTLTFASAQAAPLLGTKAPVYDSALCRELGCRTGPVRDSLLEGSRNPVRTYTYPLPQGQQLQVTRYRLPGQAANRNIYSVRYTKGTSPPYGASNAARVASVVAGRTITRAAVAACWTKGEGTISQAGFNDPVVSCVKTAQGAGVVTGFIN